MRQMTPGSVRDIACKKPKYPGVPHCTIAHGPEGPLSLDKLKNIIYLVKLLQRFCVQDLFVERKK